MRMPYPGVKIPAFFQPNKNQRQNIEFACDITEVSG
jgi:hypothetical protein